MILFALYLIPALFAALSFVCAKLARVYSFDGDHEEARASVAAVIVFGALAVVSVVAVTCIVFAPETAQ